MVKKTMEKQFQTFDGISVKYYEYKPRSCLEGRYLLCCPGWLCSAKKLLHDLESIAEQTQFILVTIEWRGHGNSIIKFGDKISIDVLAQDLARLMECLQLVSSQTLSISLLGHSMGVNVIWRYIALFGESKIDRYVFVDQPVAITGPKNPNETSYRKEWRVHSKFEVYLLSLFCLFKSMMIPLVRIFAPSWARSDFLDFVARCNSFSCSRLLIDTAFTDNTKRIQLVTHPCLIYGGEASFVNSDVARWISNQVRGPKRLLIYPKPYGTHFPFSEVKDDLDGMGPKRFAIDVSSFLLINDLK